MTLTYATHTNGYDAWAASRILYADCRPIEPWKETLIQQTGCNKIQQVNFNELTTPVSLLWSPETGIQEISSRSKFPLNPSEAGKWFEWKASGLSPLVVWDPEKSGKISEAKQLFGNHTWGKEWKNGYEPLASLDQDKNGWLENTELANIALWFDFNQDGVSDPDEVISLEKAKVEAIGVKSSSTDTDTGNIFAEQGFRRKLSDGVVIGRSVDWFSGVVEGRYGMEALVPPLDDATLRNFKNTAVKQENPSEQLAGFWSWRAVDPKGEELVQNLPSGSFTLYETAKGVEGTAYIAGRLAPNTAGLGEVINFSKILGTTSKTTNGRMQITFNTKSAEGRDVRSTAKLLDNGAVLAGVTTEEQGGDKKTVTYMWVAKRIDDLH